MPDTANERKQVSTENYMCMCTCSCVYMYRCEPEELVLSFPPACQVELVWVKVEERPKQLSHMLYVSGLVE